MLVPKYYVCIMKLAIQKIKFKLPEYPKFKLCTVPKYTKSIIKKTHFSAEYVTYAL